MINTEEIEWAEQQFDKTHHERKNGIGYVYYVPGWCGPWCCYQKPENRKIRKYYRWNRTSVHGWSKLKTLRTHRTGDRG